MRVGMEPCGSVPVPTDSTGPIRKDNTMNNPSLFPMGEPNDAYARYFIGQSYLAPLLNKEISLSNVTFEPGCRNNWHIHHNSPQILIAVGGVGYYQEWGRPVVTMQPGDVVYVPAETKHWHGATPHALFAHLAIMIPGADVSNEWLEPVDDETYYALEAEAAQSSK